MNHLFTEFEDVIRREMTVLSNTLYENPELSGEELQSKELHKTLLKSHGFNTINLEGPQLETAFVAEFDSGIEGRSVAFLAEYDALPSVGHGCGHNMLGTVSTGAAILLSKVLSSVGGKVYLMGTPAEETYGGKIPMINAGIFDEIDFAMMAHPGSETKVSGESLACHYIEVIFQGKSAHAAADPDKGINALSAMLLTYMGINTMREHFTDDVRVHGIIQEGGVAANIVPDRTRGKFRIRAGKKKTADAAREKFYNIVKGAELMTGAIATIENIEYSYDDMNTNSVLSQVCTESMKETGFDKINMDTTFKASIDMGNVSYCVPAIHPHFGITDGRDIALHTKEFAEATLTDYAYDQMIRMASALAVTAYKVMGDPALFKAMLEEFEQMIK